MEKILVERGEGLRMSLEGWQPYGPAQPVGPAQPWAQQSTMRASDADRDRAGDVLKAGFAEGRLRQEEFEARLDRVQRASTYGELHALVADLPQGPVQAQPAPAPAPMAPMAPPPWPQQPGPRPWPTPPPTNGNAVAALICGLLTPLTWGLTAIPSVVLGHKARAELRRSHEQGHGYAVTGLVLGYLGIAFWATLLLILILVLA